jgi:hypothetical protein
MDSFFLLNSRYQILNLFSGDMDIFILFFSIIGILIGAYFINKKPEFKKQVTFVVTDVTINVTYTVGGRNQPSRRRITYNLMGKVKECNDKVYSLYQYDGDIKIGDTISVWIKENCETGEARRYSDKSMNLFIGIALVIFCSLFLIGYVYVNKKVIINFLSYLFLKLKSIFS